MNSAKIMVVEDDGISALLLKTQLTDLGYTVTGTAARGDEALALAGTTRPDLVLMDIILKGEMDGIEAAQQIKERFHIPVIYVTAYGDSPVLERARVTEPYGYLLKPINERELRAVIEMALYKHRAEGELRTLSKNLATNLRKTQEGEIAGQVKSLFLANVGHELRTPLNAVTGFSQMLKDEVYGPLNPKQRQYVDQIGEGGARLTAIINRMLEMAQLSAREVALTLTRMPLQDLLRLSLALFPDLAARRHIALSLELGPGAEGLLEVDPGKFQQIMVNLLENAVKFTPEGGAVTVTGGRATALPPGLAGAPEDWGQVSVKDTGIGIDPQDLDRLFQDFVQLEAPLTKTYAGVGLGLAQTRRLVELHGGRIWAESQPGKGSAFIFILPLKHSPEEDQDHD